MSLLSILVFAPAGKSILELQTIFDGMSNMLCMLGCTALGCTKDVQDSQSLLNAWWSLFLVASATQMPFTA